MAFDVIPCLTYRDAPAAIEWLTGTFGFEVAASHPGEQPGTIAHAELAWADGMVMLGSGGNPAIERPAGSGLVYVVVDDVKRHHERVTAAGAEIVTPLEDKGYGTDYTVRDPEGNLWSFGDYRPARPSSSA
jgi:uncharacterized glyoxalase superfamily protein PhnB